MEDADFLPFPLKKDLDSCDRDWPRHRRCTLFRCAEIDKITITAQIHLSSSVRFAVGRDLIEFFVEEFEIFAQKRTLLGKE